MGLRGVNLRVPLLSRSRWNFAGEADRMDAWTLSQKIGSVWNRGDMATLFGAIDLNLSWYLALAALSITLIIGVPMALRVIREAKGEIEPVGGDTDDLLAPLSEAYAEGQMSEDEYQRIQASILRGGVDPVVFAKLKPAKPSVRPDLSETDQNAERGPGVD
jgi:uncharacterized membrane protein